MNRIELEARKAIFFLFVVSIAISFAVLFLVLIIVTFPVTIAKHGFNEGFRVTYNSLDSISAYYNKLLRTAISPYIDD